MKNLEKEALSNKAKEKVKGGKTDDLSLFKKVKTMDSKSSLVELKGEEFLALKGKTHRALPEE